MSGGNPQDYYCPLCKGTDRVEKVSVLYEASTAMGSYGTDGSMRVFIETVESSKFTPPGEPTYQEPHYPLWNYPVALITFILLFPCIGWLIYELTHLGHSGIFLNEQELAINPLIFIAVFILEGTLLITTFKIIFPRAKSRQKAQKEAWAITHRRWERAMEAWRRLYYCKLHDIVFLSGRNEKYVSASHMRELLYS